MKQNYLSGSYLPWPNLTNSESLVTCTVFFFVLNNHCLYNALQQISFFSGFKKCGRNLFSILKLLGRAYIVVFPNSLYKKIILTLFLKHWCHQTEIFLKKDPFIFYRMNLTQPVSLYCLSLIAVFHFHNGFKINHFNFNEILKYRITY